MLAWIDLETTGLKPEECEILEVGLLVTDNDLNEVHAQSWVLPYEYDTDKALTISPIVQEMHTKNELWKECAELSERHASDPAHYRADCGRNEIVSKILATLRRFTAAKDGPICGSTVAFDRRFLEVHMPLVAAHFSHRNLDVSVLAEIAKLWAPEVYEKRPKPGGHRALPDIRASVEGMRYWRANLAAVLG
jgi:oligoribonuclease